MVICINSSMVLADVVVLVINVVICSNSSTGVGIPRGIGDSSM